MLVSTDIPSGSGRVLRADASAIEIEMIAFAKEARYLHCSITDIREDRLQPVVLRPDRWFRAREFRHFHQHIWLREGADGPWRVLAEAVVEKTPSGVRFELELKRGRDVWISTEPPREYSESCRLLVSLTHRFPQSTQLHHIGTSIEGRPILLLRVTAPENMTPPGQETRPVIHITCGEHGIEFAGEEMGRGMLALALEDRALQRDFIFDIVLNINPDGTHHGWHNYNARDWLAHNYADHEDRSWHHEFAPFLTGTLHDPSPETVALVDWLRQTAPAFYISLHSWHGLDGQPGAFHAPLCDLSPAFGRALDAVNSIAQSVAGAHGARWLARESGSDGRHLGGLLMSREICLAYLPEAHMNLGRECLQTLGREILAQWLRAPGLSLSGERARERWRAFRKPDVDQIPSCL